MLIIYQTKLARRNQRWRWKLVSNGRKIANGGEGYSDRAECAERALAIIRGAYSDAEIVNG